AISTRTWGTMATERFTNTEAHSPASKDSGLPSFCIMIVSEVVRADSAKSTPNGLTTPPQIHYLQFSHSGVKKVGNHLDADAKSTSSFHATSHAVASGIPRRWSRTTGIET